MTDWVKIGTNVVVGGGGGALDQVIQNADEKREAEAGEKLPVMKQYGTYYNYGIPIASIFAVAFGALRGDWATRLVTLGSALAGRKGTWQLTVRKTVPWTGWTRQRQATEAARQRALAASRSRAQVGGATSEVGIPVITDDVVLV